MAIVRVPVKPELLVWARERARIEPAELAKAFPRLSEWEQGKTQPTLKQLEAFARRTHAPIGYFFLKAPPSEPLPIPDFRTIRNEAIARPSADLLETIYISQERQGWYSQHLKMEGHDPLPFVGSLAIGGDVVAAAAAIRQALGFEVEARAGLSFDDTFRLFRRQAEALGILVMTSGVVGNSTKRKLDSSEFRGFALVDPYVPLIFVNTADSIGAQIFTLAHELVHIWTGRSGIVDGGVPAVDHDQAERWCNAVAAELLVPFGLLSERYRVGSGAIEEAQRLARYFKVSSLVVLRRIHDAGMLASKEFWHLFSAERERLREIAAARPAQKGGSFYNPALARINRDFAAAVVSSTLEGTTTYKEAFRLLSVKNVRVLSEIGRRVGVLA